MSDARTSIEAERIKDRAGHFFELASYGNLPGASGGARRARALADAIIANAPGLDAEALRGAALFLAYAAHCPGSAAEMY